MTTTVKFLDLKNQYLSIKPEIDAAIASVIENSAFIGGTFLNQFETEFAKYIETQFCIGVANGTDAIEIALESLNLTPNSEIIVPANTFIASSEAVTRTGHKVVFADCDPDTYTLDPDSVRSLVTNDTSALIAVHLYGHPCDMDSLRAIAEEYDLKIIEDCAQAHGATYKGKKVGSIGDCGTFSFYPGKNLGCYGDGGAITTNDENLATKIRKLSNHGRLEKYNHELEGRNSRLDGMQAAILTTKLHHLDHWLDKRAQLADRYIEKLRDYPKIKLPNIKPQVRHAFHLFVVQIDHRDYIREQLALAGIETGIHYPICLAKLNAYQYLDQDFARLPISSNCDIRLLSLPLGEHLNFNDVDIVCEKILSLHK